MPISLHRPRTRLVSLGTLVVLLAVVPVDAQAPPTAPEPTIELAESAIVVRTGTPGARVVLFGFAHRERNFITTVMRHEEILDDFDQDGVVALELAEPLPGSGVWVAVDLGSGRSAVAATPGLILREISLPKRWIADSLDRLDLELPMAEFLLVRPTVGAWGLRAGDGGASDEDGQPDGRLRAALAGMWNLGDSPLPPQRLQPGDVVVVVEPQSLRFTLVRLTA